jgi:VWFA-related protein
MIRIRTRFAPRQRLALSLILVAVAAAGAGSQSRPDPGDAGQSTASEPRPTFRAEANYVRVDVFPTKDGQAVRDLTQADFELYEDGVPQKVETFEHVEVRTRLPQEGRREPNTAAEGRAMAEDPRARVFIVFLDTYHTEVDGSHRMRRVLVDLLDRIIGPDDLFGVMTPEMSATDVTLARRTTTIEGYLSRYWYWGRRDRITTLDPIEQQYEECFPEGQGEMCSDPSDPTGRRRVQQGDIYRGVAREMIARRREKRVLDALTDLSRWLGGVREERKAVITISDGWLLFRENKNLLRQGPCGMAPVGPQVGVGPDGRLTSDLPLAQGNYSPQTCVHDRQTLAYLDNWQFFHDMFDEANRYNVSFYTIDPRGLPASDAQIWEDVPPAVDQRMLTTRIENLRTLSLNTDGLSVTNSNDIQKGVRRIVDDLTSYYLLGYYSTNAKLDGKFRSIKVRVKRPGVDVRARRGYKAATQKELTEGRQLTSNAAAAAPPSAFAAAMGALAAARSDFRFLTSVSWIAAPLDDSVPGAKSQLWVTGELDEATAKGPEWGSGATAEVLLTAEDGVKIAEQTVKFDVPVRVVSVALPDVAIGPGEYALRLRVKPAGGGLPFMDTVRFTVADDGDLVGKPRLLRRGPTTGPQFVVTADPRYRRTDRIKVEVPMLGAADKAEGELLDKNGQALSIPVQAGMRDEDGALKWASAEAALAPLAPGDYALRATITRGSKTEQVVTAFRVVP